MYWFSHVFWGRRPGAVKHPAPALPQVLTGMFSRTTGRIDDRWQAFMKFQIGRARQCFADAEAGVDHLDSDARWPVWSALILYRCARQQHPLGVSFTRLWQPPPLCMLCAGSALLAGARTG